jgi:eukaryotic-like serine/threonine-protein kinase
MTTVAADRNLLFGLLALQNGLVNQDQLLEAFGSWTRDKSRPIADFLAEHGYIDSEKRDLMDELVNLHVARSGGNVERSLASILASRWVRESLAGVGDLDFDDALSRLGLGSTLDYFDREARHADGSSVGSSTSDGQRFRVLRPHAHGGLGAVFVALDTELKREVALKQILDKYADDLASRRRFVLEAEVTGGLEHPGVVPVYGLGTDDDGRPYYAMRFIEGDSLGEAIHRFHVDAASTKDPGRRSLGLRQLLRNFTDVCNTIAYAHSRGVLHRDIKPANVIVGRYGETLVVDWGLAKPMDSVGSGTETVSSTPTPCPARESAGTVPGYAMGTPAYMSPEQAEGRLDRLGPRSDVYGLGATLYSILTGKPPLEGPDHKIILARVSAGDFPRPRQVDPAVPVGLEAICLKAMALRPEGRYATPRELGEEIERWLADEPVLAYPEPFSVRVMRWVRRRKQWVAAAAAVLILTVLGLAIHDRQMAREKARTAEQLAMTRGALRELLAVSGERLAFVPNSETLREQLASLVLDRYQQLGDRFPTDAGVRLETAQVLRVIGGIGRITGQFAKAQESYDRAIGLLTTLCEEDPGHPEYRRWLAESFLDRGGLNHLYGRTLDAEKDHRAAIRHADKLVSPAISTSGRRVTASALIDLSEILVLRALPAEARTSADRAVDLLRPLAADAKLDSAIGGRWLLAMALTARGVASGSAGDRDRAARDLDEASQVAGSVVRGEEVYDDAQFQLACIANRRGELARKEPSKQVESEGYFEEASRILARLMKDHEQIPHYRKEMALALCGRAAARLATTRIPEAQGDCEAALAHLTWLIGEQTRRGAPENPEYLSLLGRVLARQGRIHCLRDRSPEARQTRAEAVENLRRAIRLDPARAADKVALERMTADPDRWDD